jgi:hypothetical protein
MTHAFPASRLDEIAEAAPVQPVSFPGAAQVARVRQTLGRIRSLLVPPAGPRERGLPRCRPDKPRRGR